MSVGDDMLIQTEGWRGNHAPNVALHATDNQFVSAAAEPVSNPVALCGVTSSSTWNTFDELLKVIGAAKCTDRSRGTRRSQRHAGASRC